MDTHSIDLDRSFVHNKSKKIDVLSKQLFMKTSMAPNFASYISGNSRMYEPAINKTALQLNRNPF